MDEQLEFDELYQGYEEWLDEVEKTLPLPISEEEQMAYERTRVVQQIYSRLASLEQDREAARLNDQPTEEIDKEMTALRIKLQDVMNSPCPVFTEE